MKKNAIAVILSVVMAVGSFGAVPVFAADAEPVENTEESLSVDDDEPVQNTADELVEVTTDESELNITDTVEQSDFEQAEQINTDASEQSDFEQAEQIDTGASEQSDTDSLEPFGVNQAGKIDTVVGLEDEEESAPVLEEAASEEVSNEASMAVIDSGSCGKNLTWSLEGNGELTISGYGDMDFGQANCPWYYHRKSIRKVILPKGLTSTALSAFSESSISEISLPEGLIKITDLSFLRCENLTELTLPSTLVTLGSRFVDSTGIIKLTIPKSVTECTTRARYFSDKAGPLAGSNVRDLEFEKGTVRIPDNICLGEYYIEQVDMEPLVSVVENVWIPASVQSIGKDAFCRCDKLSDVYYRGTKEDWAKISIESGNESLLNANIHYLGDLVLPGKTTRGDMYNLASNVKVTWKEVAGAKYYKVYREGVTDKTETREEPVIVTSGLVGWDKDPGLTNGHAYRYKIVASLTGKGDPSGDSTQSYSKLMYRLKTVVIRSVKNTAPGKVTVKYDKTTSGDSYVLQYCEREDMVGAKTKVVLGASNTSYVIGGLKKGKTYYISIRVRKKVNGIDYYTTFGVAKKIKVVK